ncbi:endonuclease SmrB [Neptunicella sp.]|uniref:endonuclease SmrB n=1 Tax=Neptunicella sp. TaxID=2125986 RepID=UPI003F68ECD0
MTKKKPVSLADIHLFRDEIEGVKPLKQDKIQPKRLPSKQKKSAGSELHKQNQAEFFFSDQFHAHFDLDGPLKYTQPGADSHEVKRLRRGEMPPDLILDLHGLNKEQAKMEIAALIRCARQNHYECVCIVHGIGSHVLKKAVPSWLVQHPSVLGFHQAPLEWGGKGALLVLLKRHI